MARTNIVAGVTLLVCFFLTHSAVIAKDTRASEGEMREFRQELAGIVDLEKSLASTSTRSLAKYEKFADGIQHKWSQRNKEYYARLMLAICSPLGSGDFKNARQYELARKYALSALENRDAIPVVLELELAGQVTTLASNSKALKEEDFAQRRRKDVDVKLHAWKRLLDAVDPNWNPSERLSVNVPLPPGVSGSSGMSPTQIKDDALRAEYEEAIERNKKKIERHTEQRKLRNWLERFPEQAESYIIRAYSKPPVDVAELRQLVNRYLADATTRARILDAVQGPPKKS